LRGGAAHCEVYMYGGDAAFCQVTLTTGYFLLRPRNTNRVCKLFTVLSMVRVCTSGAKRDSGCTGAWHAFAAIAEGLVSLVITPHLTLDFRCASVDGGR